MTREEFKNKLAIEIVARFAAKSSRGTPIAKESFINAALWAFDTLALPIFHQFYGPDEVPPEVIHEGDGQGYSQDVLIDMDGEQKHYAIGWYDYDEKAWRFDNDDTSYLEPAHMTWTYIKRNELIK